MLKNEQNRNKIIASDVLPRLMFSLCLLITGLLLSVGTGVLPRKHAGASQRHRQETTQAPQEPQESPHGE